MGEKMVYSPALRGACPRLLPMRFLAGAAAVLAAYLLIWVAGSRGTAFLVDLFRPTPPAVHAEAVRLTGTLTYYPDNKGRQMPYLVYTDSAGRAWTKALVFDYGSECLAASADYPCSLISDALPHYFSEGAVEVEGIVSASSLIVEYLGYVPDT